MESATKDAGEKPLVVTSFATLAAIVWGPGWLPYVALCVGTAWFVQSRPARLKLGAALLAAVFAMALVNSFYGIGKDMALRDNARTENAR